LSWRKRTDSRGKRREGGQASEEARYEEDAECLGEERAVHAADDKADEEAAEKIYNEGSPGEAVAEGPTAATDAR